MRSLAIGSGAVLALLFVANMALADSVASGKVKGVSAEKKEFIMTDSAGKDWTFKLHDKAVINRGGKESQSDLAAGDPISVHYDKGVLTWTANYILVREGDSKSWDLAHGKVKSYEGDKKLLTVTDEDGKDTIYAASDAKAWLNNKECKFDDMKIGEHVLAIVNKEGGKTTLKAVMCSRK